VPRIFPCSAYSSTLKKEEARASEAPITIIRPHHVTIQNHQLAITRLLTYHTYPIHNSNQWDCTFTLRSTAFFVQSLDNTVYYGKAATVGRQVRENSRRGGDKGKSRSVRRFIYDSPVDLSDKASTRAKTLERLATVT
jgi:hypothetical protein